MSLYSFIPKPAEDVLLSHVTSLRTDSPSFPVSFSSPILSFGTYTPSS
jgi:hypothetical protein